MRKMRQYAFESARQGGKTMALAEKIAAKKHAALTPQEILLYCEQLMKDIKAINGVLYPSHGWHYELHDALERNGLKICRTNQKVT